jgi:hypothetical protein
MPVYEVTSPDGKKYQVDAPPGASMEDAIKYVQTQIYSKKVESPKREETSVGKAAIHGLGQGLTLGFSDEISGAGAALKEAVLPSDFNKDKGILERAKDAYVGVRDGVREANNESQKDHPGWYGGTELAGAVAPIIATGGALTTAMGTKAALTPLSTGAITSLGNSNENTVGGLAEDTIKGAALGALAGKGVQLLGKGAQVAGKVGQASADFTDRTLDTISKKVGEFTQKAGIEEDLVAKAKDLAMRHPKIRRLATLEGTASLMGVPPLATSLIYGTAKYGGKALSKAGTAAGASAKSFSRYAGAETGDSTADHPVGSTIYNKFFGSLGVTPEDQAVEITKRLNEDPSLRNALINRSSNDELEVENE